ncbi:MAG: prepilin-type N-terminal cleavage/methylation domain-containing protein [Nitrospirota bacterium]
MKERIKKRLTSHVSRLTNRGGFTLIELAIVLVIIGIIIGAILKGGDIIEGARHKKLTSECRKWETLTWAFMDRKGAFPGDFGGDKDGTIETGENPKTDLTTAGRFLDPPTVNSVTMGGYTFYLWLGSQTARKNIIGITNDATTPGAFTDPELAYMEAIDTSIDGVSDGTSGRVLACTGSILNSATWLMTNCTFAAWDTTITSLAYFFDRKP